MQWDHSTSRAGHEIKAVALGFAIVSAYVLFVLAHPKVEASEFLRLFDIYTSRIFGAWLIAAIVAVMIHLIRAWKPGGEAPPPLRVVADYYRSRWQRDYLLSFVWPPLLFAMLMASFNTFKQLILPGAGFRFDTLFANMDHALFLGREPWQITHALLPSPWASYVMDLAYHAWFVPMSIGVLVCSFLWNNYRLRTQYLLTYILVWIMMGSVLAYFLSASGPCFYHVFADHSARFTPLIAKLNADLAAVGTSFPDASFVALHYQEGLLKIFGQSHLVVGGGISAMPSVHNGLAVLFACAAFQINRYAGWTMAAYAALIWISSIHLGWHYAIDGLAALPLTIAIWVLMGRLADRLQTVSPIRVTQPLADSGQPAI